MAKRLDDPKDVYVRSPEPVSLTQLVALFKGTRGCSYSQLARRCRYEAWVVEREKFFAKVEQKAETMASTKLAKQKRVITLEELNDDAYSRAQMLLKINEQKIKDAVKKRQVKAPDGQAYQEPYVDMEPRELRTIQQNILELHRAMRLYCNFDPDKPVEAKADNSKDDTFLDALFEPIFGPREVKKADAGTDTPSDAGPAEGDS